MTLHIYYCPSCDSFVFKTGEAMAVSCCGETLQPLTAGTSDGAREKHVPVVTHEGDLLHVQVGGSATSYVGKPLHPVDRFGDRRGIPSALSETGRRTESRLC